MMGLKQSKIYPVIGILNAIFLIVFGLVMAKEINLLYYFGAVWLLFTFAGCHAACFKVLPVTALFALAFSAISYAVTKNAVSSYAMASRLLAIGLALIPAMSIRPVDLTRNLTQLKVPRSITLGMLIALSFVPMLRLEIKRIREAMKTRGAGGWNPQILYRSFFIPLVMRLVNISDTLALSVETRGFQTDKSEVTVFRKVNPNLKDFILVALQIAGAVVLVVL